ncbi:hypothetical protein [Tardiphaga sp. 709]|nr:hypothetical protein [Tardiphaga sp. 709]WNV09999.1 hypothetical protein RSO67_02020 [Tardiphaga sp. 709]
MAEAIGRAIMAATGKTRMQPGILSEKPGHSLESGGLALFGEDRA